MIESRFPCNGIVALRTIVIELPLYVIRIRDATVFILMTLIAIGVCDVVIAVDMTFFAGGGVVRAC